MCGQYNKCTGKELHYEILFWTRETKLFKLSYEFDYLKIIKDGPRTTMLHPTFTSMAKWYCCLCAYNLGPQSHVPYFHIIVDYITPRALQLGLHNVTGGGGGGQTEKIPFLGHILIEVIVFSFFNLTTKWRAIIFTILAFNEIFNCTRRKSDLFRLCLRPTSTLSLPQLQSTWHYMVKHCVRI